MTDKRFKFLIVSFIFIYILNLIEPSENEITEIVALFYYHLNFTFNVMVALEIIPYINNFFEI